MRRLISVIVVMLSVADVFAAAPSELWEEANGAYINGDYGRALVLYDSIASQGYISGKLYYNLGNANFKAGRLGGAILNYKRAIKLEPYNSDFRYNLSIAESRTKDKIEALPGFAFGAWIDGWRSYLTSNMWAVVSLIMVAGVLAGVMVYLLSRGRRWRKGGFYIAIILGVMALLALWFSIAEKRNMERREGVVMVSAASVSSSPEGNGRELFVLHEGAVVGITGDYATWVEVSLADGNKGWMQRSAIEMI